MMSWLSSITDTIGNVSGAIGNATKGILPTTITEKKSAEIVQKVKAPVKAATDTIGNVTGSVGSGISSAVKGVTDTIGNVSGSIGNFTGKYGKYIPIAAAAVGGLALLSVLKK